MRQPVLPATRDPGKRTGAATARRQTAYWRRTKGALTEDRLRNYRAAGSWLLTSAIASVCGRAIGSSRQGPPTFEFTGGPTLSFKDLRKSFRAPLVQAQRLQTAARKPPVRAWQLHHRLRGGSGIFAFNAASPAGVMRYLSPRLAPICFLTQPFAIMPAIVHRLAGYSCTNDSPRVALIFCKAVRSR